MEYQPKTNGKCTPFLHCISSFEGTSYKNLEDTTTRSFVLFYCCFTKLVWMSDSIAQRNRGPEQEVDLGNIFECLNDESSDNESETRTKTS